MKTDDSSEMPEELKAKRDELAEYEANYFSHIQFPIEWKDCGHSDVKMDIYSAVRKRCHDDHKWGIQKGFDKCYELMSADNAKLKAQLGKAVIVLRSANEYGLQHKESCRINYCELLDCTCGAETDDVALVKVLREIVEDGK